MGTVVLELHLPCSVTDQPKPFEIMVVTDVVHGYVPLLISKKALVSMKGRIDFVRSLLQIEHWANIRLINLPSGHIALPAQPSRPEDVARAPLAKVGTLNGKAYVAHEEWGLTPISDEELKKVHLRLSRCSEFTLRNLLKAGHSVLDPEQITRIMRSCTRKGAVGRAKPPKVSGRMGKFNGGIMGIDLVYPFVGVREGATGRNYAALLIVDCLSRFALCSLIEDVRAATLINIPIDDWIRPLGKPRMIIMDHGPPGMFGGEWGDFPHTYAVKLAHAPQGEPYRNGLHERVVRSLKTA